MLYKLECEGLCAGTKITIHHMKYNNKKKVSVGQHRLDTEPKRKRCIRIFKNFKKLGFENVDATVELEFYKNNSFDIVNSKVIIFCTINQYWKIHLLNVKMDYSLLLRYCNKVVKHS